MGMGYSIKQLDIRMSLQVIHVESTQLGHTHPWSFKTKETHASDSFSIFKGEKKKET